jgi:hypothetical protein
LAPAGRRELIVIAMLLEEFEEICPWANIELFLAEDDDFGHIS